MKEPTMSPTHLRIDVVFDKARRARRRAYKELTKAVTLGNQALNAAEEEGWDLPQALIDRVVNQVQECLEAFTP